MIDSAHAMKAARHDRPKGAMDDAQPLAGRMVALMGDAEFDEGNVFEAVLEGWKQRAEAAEAKLQDLQQCVKLWWTKGEHLLQKVTLPEVGQSEIAMRVLAIDPDRLDTDLQSAGDPDVALGVRRNRSEQPDHDRTPAVQQRHQVVDLTVHVERPVVRVRPAVPASVVHGNETHRFQWAGQYRGAAKLCWCGKTNMDGPHIYGYEGTSNV